jgi:hypothetical protein
LKWCGTPRPAPQFNYGAKLAMQGKGKGDLLVMKSQGAEAGHKSAHTHTDTPYVR